MQTLGLYLLFFIMTVGDADLTEQEQDWLFLAEILRDQTSCIEDPAEKLRSMTEWLRVHVKHVPRGRYPEGFDQTSIVTIIKGGYGNCGIQSYNMVGFAQMLGYPKHRVLHHRKRKGAPGDHTFAEIHVNGRWIIYDPDKFLYFTDESDRLLGAEEVAADPESWVGISLRNSGFITMESAKNAPTTDFDYYRYEKMGMPYIRLALKMRAWFSPKISEDK